MKKLTINYPYYNQPKWLGFILEWLNNYSAELKKRIDVVLVDDGSFPFCIDTIKNEKYPIPENLRLYRIHKDIPWNSGGAQNLAAYNSNTSWLLKLDLDHFIPEEEIWRFLRMVKDENTIYKFSRRWSFFKKKFVKAPYSCHFVHRNKFWEIGGHDEDFSGNIGSYPIYWLYMEKCAKIKIVEGLLLNYTNNDKEYEDASITSLSRDQNAFKKLYSEKKRQGIKKAVNPLRFEWVDQTGFLQ